MKRMIKKWLVAVSAVSVLVSCSGTGGDRIVLTGKVAHYKNRVVSVLDEDRKLVGSAELTAEGNFSIEIEANKAQRYEFRTSKEYAHIYLKPGDELNIELDADEFDESLRFSGEGSEYNTFLIRKYLVMEHLTSESVLAFHPKDFLLALELNTQELWELLDQIKDPQNPFVLKQKHLLELQLADLKLNYPKYFEFISGDDLIVPSSYFDFLNLLNINDESLLDSKEGKRFLSSYINYKASVKAGSEEALEISKHKLDVIQEEFVSAKLRSQMAYFALKEHLGCFGTEQAEALKDKFDALVNEAELKQEMNAYYDKVKELAPGKPSKDFTYPDKDGKLVSLSDFLGQYVYIDVWASWCGPCLGEIPHLKALEESYRDKNIVFMSVSLDEDKDKAVWETMLEDEGLRGIQLFASGWSQIAKDYDVNGIPRFILIDPDGRIVNSRAPRPSSTAAEELFQSLKL